MITEQQRQQRRNFIGSSDAAALFGLDPFKTAADVYLEKTGRVTPDEGSEATDRGTLLEPAVLDWAQREIGVEFARGVMLTSEPLAANFDGLSFESAPAFVVEAKTTTACADWGDPGTDEVPERVIVQVHHQFAVAGPAFRLAYVPVLMPLFGRFVFRMYRVERRDDLAEAVADAGREFMLKHVRADTPPPDCLPMLDTLRRMVRQPNKTVPLDEGIAASLIKARAAKSECEKACKDVERIVLAALGDAEAGEFPGGRITYLETKRKGYTVAESSYRTLRVKTERNGQ